MVPLSAVATFSRGQTPLGVNHQGLFAATTISFNLAPGHALSEAQQAIADAVPAIRMPSTMHGIFAGTAATFQQSLANAAAADRRGAARRLHRARHSLRELHPPAHDPLDPAVGRRRRAARLELFGAEFTIIAAIGVILLIGIVKKNAIMMIDFALQAEREGLAPREAIAQACLLRFRPIMMTTFAAMFGALPLALGTGEGAELRHPLGITIVGGLLVSQALTLYTTPVIYLYLDRFGKWLGRLWRRFYVRGGSVRLAESGS